MAIALAPTGAMAAGDREVEVHGGALLQQELSVPRLAEELHLPGRPDGRFAALLEEADTVTVRSSGSCGMTFVGVVGAGWKQDLSPRGTGILTRIGVTLGVFLRLRE